MSWVFVFACVAFSCRPEPALPGDGAYYATRQECRDAAHAYARSHHISHRWEPTCVEREKPR